MGGARWADPAHGQRPRPPGPAATAAGVTARWRNGCREAARPRSRGPAALRPTCHQAQRLARRSSRPEHSRSGIQAARLRAWRVAGVTIWHARSTRSEAQRSGAQRRARAAGQFVKRARRSRTRDGHQGPRSPATGRAAFVITAGAAGLAVLREGWKPVRVETRTAARCEARQPGPAQRGRAHPSAPSPASRQSWAYAAMQPPHIHSPSS